MIVEIKNAIINSARLETGDRGFLTVWLDLDYGGLHQGFGGYALCLPKSFSNHTVMSSAGHFIARCLDVAGVDDWKNIVGMSIRVRSDRNGVNAIGHIIKDDWFCPSEDFKVLP